MHHDAVGSFHFDWWNVVNVLQQVSGAGVDVGKTVKPEEQGVGLGPRLGPSESNYDARSGADGNPLLQVLWRWRFPKTRLLEIVLPLLSCDGASITKVGGVAALGTLTS
jgi:hypothetical protein